MNKSSIFLNIFSKYPLIVKKATTFNGHKNDTIV